MNTEIQENLNTTEDLNRTESTNILAISIIAFVLLLLAVAGQITYTVLKNDNVYTGVFLNENNVSGLSREKLTEYLNKNYRDKVRNVEITLENNDLNEKFKFYEIGVYYDVPSAVNKAFEIGRTGNIFKRMYDIITYSKNPVKISVPYTYSKNKVIEKIQSIESSLPKVKETDIKFEADKVLLISGQHGKEIDKNNLFSQIEESISKCNNSSIKLTFTTTQPKNIDVDAFYNKISQEPVDAKFSVENNSVTVVPHIAGRSIEKSSLQTIASEIEKTENSERILPVVFTQPKITTEIAQANLFKDRLGSMSTYFSTSSQNDANRGVNIRIAVSKINGTILAPGQEFSFNGVVGPRTAAAGYKTAHTYVGGEIVDGVGGGICQVSTTLYNALLFSDLNVTERTNHMFTVGYVPLGRDAAVSYGSVDLKFKNSTNWPVKIEGWVSNANQIYFAVKGTNETPGKEVIISPQTIQTLQAPEPKYINDPTLPEGTQIVTQNSMSGAIVDTYKIVKQNGSVISQTKLHRSTYNPLAQEIKRGTKKAQSQSRPNSTEKKPVGVDEAANPPANQ